LVMEDIEGDDIEIEFQEIKMHYLVSEELDWLVKKWMYLINLR
jgi:hypothetical protein